MTQAVSRETAAAQRDVILEMIAWRELATLRDGLIMTGLDAGLPIRQIAQYMGISRNAIYRVKAAAGE